MKLLASLILPTFCQRFVTTPEVVNKCGYFEKWDSCGNPCMEKTCKDWVHTRKIV